MVVAFIDLDWILKFPVLLNRLRIVTYYLGSIVTNFRLISIAKEIAPNVSGVDRSWIVFVWFSVLINRLRKLCPRFGINSYDIVSGDRI